MADTFLEVFGHFVTSWPQRTWTQAQRDQVEVVIHEEDGSILDSDSYTRDPNPPKDKTH